MNHPPLPPNCDLFIAPYVTKEGRTVGTQFHLPGEFIHLYASDCSTFWDGPRDIASRILEQHRLIIASVAEVAWLKEAARRSGPFETEAEARSAGPAVYEAQDNAKAWREWAKPVEVPA